MRMFLYRPLFCLVFLVAMAMSRTRSSREGCKMQKCIYIKRLQNFAKNVTTCIFKDINRHLHWVQLPQGHPVVCSSAVWPSKWINTTDKVQLAYDNLQLTTWANDQLLITYLDWMLDCLSNSESRCFPHQWRLPEPGLDVTSRHPSRISGRINSHS